MKGSVFFNDTKVKSVIGSFGREAIWRGSFAVDGVQEDEHRTPTQRRLKAWFTHVTEGT